MTKVRPSFSISPHTHIHANWQATCSWFSRLNSWWPKPLTQTHSNPKNNNDNDQSKLKGFTLQIYEHQHLCHAYTHASMCTNTFSQTLWLQIIHLVLYTKKVSPQLCWVNKYMIIKQKSVSGESYRQNMLSKYPQTGVFLLLTWTGNPTAPAEGKWEGRVNEGK